MAIGRMVVALGLVIPMAQAYASFFTTYNPTPVPTPTPTPTPTPIATTMATTTATTTQQATTTTTTTQQATTTTTVAPTTTTVAPTTVATTTVLVTTTEAAVATTLESGDIVDNLQELVKEGEIELPVQNSQIYESGLGLEIDPNTDVAETNEIVGTETQSLARRLLRDDLSGRSLKQKGTIKLKTPLKHDHKANAIIKTFTKTKGTTTPAATQTTTPASKYAGSVATQVARVSNPLLIAGLFVSAAIIATVVRLAQRQTRRTREPQSYVQMADCDLDPEAEGALE